MEKLEEVPENVIDEESIYICPDNIKHILTKKTSIQNKVIDVLGGKRNRSKALFKNQFEVDTAIKKKKNIISDLSCGSMLEKDGIPRKISYLTNNERYLLMFLLAAHTQNNDTVRPVEITLDIARNIFVHESSLENYDFEAILKDAARGLMKKQFTYFEGLDMSESQILLKAQNISIDNNRSVKLILNPELNHFFISHKKNNYTNIIFLDVLSLSPRSQALYLILRRDHGYLTATNKEYRNMERRLYYSKDDILKCFNSKSSSFVKFQSTILKEAIKEINEKSDIFISFERCLKKDREEYSAKFGVNAELSFLVEIKAAKKTKHDALESIFLAKEEILKHRWIKIDKTNKSCEIINFKRHEVIENLIILTLSHGGKRFEWQIEIQKMLKMYRTIIDKKIKTAIEEINLRNPGQGDMLGISGLVKF